MHAVSQRRQSPVCTQGMQGIVFVVRRGRPTSTCCLVGSYEILVNTKVHKKLLGLSFIDIYKSANRSFTHELYLNHHMHATKKNKTGKLRTWSKLMMLSLSRYRPVISITQQLIQWTRRTFPDPTWSQCIMREPQAVFELCQPPFCEHMQNFLPIFPSKNQFSFLVSPEFII